MHRTNHKLTSYMLHNSMQFLVTKDNMPQ